MNRRYLAPSLLMTGLMAFGAPLAVASDQLAGALLGAGAGAIIGHAVGGHDAAVAGGVFGAIIGAAAADDDHRRVIVRPRPYAVYGPPSARYYAPPPPWAGPRHLHPHWRHDRDGRDPGHWDRDRGGWRDGRRDHDRDDWRRGDGPRAGGPGNYRNW